MSDVAIVIRDMPYLKLLYPICEQLSALGQKFTVYHWDHPRGDKEYIRATRGNILKSSPEILNMAERIIPFKTDVQLGSQLRAAGIEKMISVEIGLWMDKRNFNGIRTFSIQYLTDSLFKNSKNIITSTDKIYYTSKYLMETKLKFSDIDYNPSRDMYLGNPIFSPISKKSGPSVLLLLPNIRESDVPVAFGSVKNFERIFEKINEAASGKLIIKTRKKQWLPKFIRDSSNTVIYDGNTMYPPEIVRCYDSTFCTIMFFSSGIYESVYSGNHVYNITFPLSRWPYSSSNMKDYFSPITEKSVYNWPGVVTSVSQDDIDEGYSFNLTPADPTAAKEWASRYIGETRDSAELISKDIIKS